MDSDNNDFMQVGDVPSLKTVYSIAIYDPNDGSIRHIHHTAIFREPFNIDKNKLEKEAINYAEKLGHKIDDLHVLHIPNNKHFEGMYKVDVKKQTLVKVSSDIQTFAKKKGFS